MKPSTFYMIRISRLIDRNFKLSREWEIALNKRDYERGDRIGGIVKRTGDNIRRLGFLRDVALKNEGVEV